MRIVLSWLREFAPAELGAEELAELLTSKGAEVESVTRPWAGLHGVIAARVLEVRDHPGSDRLCVARVQTGSGEQDVVVGVRNMAAGDVVPLAPPGARIPPLSEPLTAREIRGVVSNGMLCAPDELGVSPSHEAILILPAELAPGTDVKRAFGLDDAVLEIEVTPNRPDFLSVIGVAREVAAATGVPFTPPDATVEESDEKAAGVASVEIADLDRCARYLARVIRDVRHVGSPLAVQARLTAAGMRPISAVVDATNYAMLEIGQPLHPFDLMLLHGPGIVVRRAVDGERLVTLDGIERTFTDDDLLIADLDRAVAVAGVMGGALAEVSASTTDVLLESASFAREGIQRTRRRIDLSTEASVRFERGVDPEAVPVGTDRACHLMQRWFDATVLAGVVEAGSAPPRRLVDLRPARASALLGYDVSAADARQVFDRLGMPNEEVDGAVRVEVPGYRVDIEREVDLIEEVVRVQGYERVGATLPPVRQAGGVPDGYAFAGRLRWSLVRSGLRETRPIPFVSETDLVSVPPDRAVRVTNPLSADEAFLRTSLLPGLLVALQRNVYRHVGGAALFEVGRVFEMAERTPVERASIGFAMTGPGARGWDEPERPFDVFDGKGVVEALLEDVGVRRWSVDDLRGGWFHPGRSAAVIVDGRSAGAVGELHPSHAARYDLTGRVVVAELDVAQLAASASDVLEIREPARFPPLRRDLAFVVDMDAKASHVQALIEGAAGELLGSCVLFDVFSGPPLPEGKRSLAFTLELRATDRSLTGDEADATVGAIEARLRDAIGAELRAG